MYQTMKCDCFIKSKTMSFMQKNDLSYKHAM